MIDPHVEPDGSIGNHRFRRAGDYALTGNDQKPHVERGGDNGGLAYFGARRDSIVAEITIDSLVADFNADYVSA